MPKLFLLLLLSPLLIVSCAQQSGPLEVDILKVRDSKEVDKDAAMVRGDQNFMFHGKVSAREREQSVGQYYTVTRRDSGASALVKFRYQQVKTRSKVLVKQAKLKPGQRKVEFKIVGDEYAQKGRVLAWRIELHQSGKPVASEQSYMW